MLPRSPVLTCVAIREHEPNKPEPQSSDGTIKDVFEEDVYVVLRPHGADLEHRKARLHEEHNRAFGT